MDVLEPGVLLERTREVEALDRALSAAAAGRGGAVLVEGPPGIGKTRLLTEVADRAADRFRVLWARGDLLERDLPYGIARQLFEDLVVAAADGRNGLLDGAAALAEPVLRPVPGAEADAPASRHGLYWLTLNLAAEGPLLILADDLHWADLPSLEWLGYLARRLDGVPILLVAGTRAPEEARVPPLEAIANGTSAIVLEPQPLSAEAVRRLVADAVGPDPDERFVAACADASGGNPFLLSELLGAAARRGIGATAEAADRLSALVPDTVTRSIVVRLDALPEGAAALARAAAVLGTDADLPTAARLAGLEPGDAATAADELVAAHVLTGGHRLGFVHPIVRGAVEDAAPPSELRRAHAEAARLLAERGAGAERRAAHLLLADPAADPEAVMALREAARQALARGAVRAAVTYLERALEEPPPTGERPGVLEELGTAAAGAADPRAVEWLREAYAAAGSEAQRGRCALALGRSLFFAGHPEEAFDAIDAAEFEAGTGERAMAARLEAELIAAARLDYALRPRVPERLARLERLGSGDPIGRAIAGCQRAYELTLAGEHHARPVAMAREALGDGELLDALGPEDPSLHTGINALALNERLEEAESAFDAVIDATRERGSSVGFAIASCFRSQVHLRRGDVRRAEADARASVEVSAEEGWGLGIPAARAFLVYALLERGELDDAERTLEEAELGEEIPELVMFDPVLECRGRLRIARGEGAAGVEDLLACGRRQERWGAHNPSVIPWRSMAAEAMLRIGRAEEALSLVEEEVALAEATGLPRATGMALRVAGLARGERETLEAAVAMLERSGTLTELARARIALGGLLRRDGQRAAAREELRLALDHADRAGAEAIAQVAREELLAAGARPRRARLSGREALTASELRVAAEAARGVSNREIAQSLFITVKTVETHLSNTYGKLGISSRSQLAEALGEDG